MICGGINTAGSGPVCRSYAANEIIDTFDSRAANANRAYKSDYEAEANIEIHYQEAYQKLNALHLGKTDLTLCIEVLDDVAGHANIYRDGILDSVVNPGLYAKYKSTSPEYNHLNRANHFLSSFYTCGISFGLAPLLRGTVGYGQRLWNMAMY